jgi:penicillin-binding protein 2
MRGEVSIVSDVSVLVTGVLILLGLVTLGVKLHEVQVDGAAKYGYDGVRQAVRRVRTAGPRGRILARDGQVLAENRESLSIAVNPSCFQCRGWDATATAISNAIASAAVVIGRTEPLTWKQIRRHVNQALARPLVVWRDIDETELAKFSEHMHLHPGFELIETEERHYPEGALAAHVLGYVGRDEVSGEGGDEKYNFRDKEMRGRMGVEHHYDAFLRGVPGEVRLTVDARGFAIGEEQVLKGCCGPDLRLSIDVGLQREVERQLRGEKGACVVLDPRDGSVLAMASAPGFDPNDFVPVLTHETYDRYAKDIASKPLLNRAAGGAYTPGSVFKPITALAGLRAGWSETETHECTGVFELGNMRLRCARRWGHGPLDIRHALRESCNPFFSSLGIAIGTNALIRAARDFGIGTKTGLDFGTDMAGVVPDAEWKRRAYHQPWYPGDLAQMSIGQSMLLVSPLRMAMVAGAIGSGDLVTPHLLADAAPERHPLPFSGRHLEVVRDGMRMVVDGGTGRRAGEGVNAWVIGKTGTAEVGRGERQRKNTWFIAYAESCECSAEGLVCRVKKPRMPQNVVAVALVVEDGQSGGGTAAPKVCAVLKSVFGEAGEGSE